MKQIIALEIALLTLLAMPAVGQTSVVIVTKVCNTNSGVQQCNYVPVDSTNPIPVIGEGTGGSTPVIPGQLTPLGQQTISSTALATATALTVPPGATIAYFVAGISGSPGTNGVCLMYRDDGVTPTATTGMGLPQLTYYNGYAGSPLSAIQFIEATGGASCDLRVSYYK